jgi:hypothetical protein
MVLVLEPRPEIKTIDLLSILKPVTEDVIMVLPIFSNAESMVDQTKMISVLKLMLNAQVYHTRDHISIELDPNSLSAVTLIPDTFGEREEMANGDLLLPTTSGITTMVLKSFAET